MLNNWNYVHQESIPIGCVSPACWPESGGVQGCVCPGCVCPGCVTRGCTPPDPEPEPPLPLWAEWLTDRCKNITLPQLRLLAVKNVAVQNWSQGPDKGIYGHAEHPLSSKGIIDPYMSRISIRPIHQTSNCPTHIHSIGDPCLQANWCCKLAFSGQQIQASIYKQISVQSFLLQHAIQDSFWKLNNSNHVSNIHHLQNDN